MTILGCSKGAEVYSFSYIVRTKRSDLNLRIGALDISREVLELGKLGSIRSTEWNRSQDLGSRSIFERMSSVEMEDLFEQEGANVRIRSRFRDGITWRLGDAGDPHLVGDLGVQDIVVANRFLCHMHPEQRKLACVTSLGS